MKTKSKRLLAILLTLAMILSMLPTTVLAAAYNGNGGYYGNNDNSSYPVYVYVRFIQYESQIDDDNFTGYSSTVLKELGYNGLNVNDNGWFTFGMLSDGTTVKPELNNEDKCKAVKADVLGSLDSIVRYTKDGSIVNGSIEIPDISESGGDTDSVKFRVKAAAGALDYTADGSNLTWHLNVYIMLDALREYTVQYINAYTKNPICDNYTGTATIGNEVTENAITKAGYVLSDEQGTVLTDNENTQKTIKISNTDSDNVITFYYVPVEYSITYNLDGGALEENESNPNTYTVEDNITLKNPTKTGYSFLGWTGSNGTDAQTEVTIPTGSTGNKEYTANWDNASVSYSVVAHYRNREGTEVGSQTLTEDATTAAYGTELSSLTTAYEESRTYNEKTYLYDNSARSVKVGDTVYTGTTLTENNTVINLYYDVDEWVDPTKITENGTENGTDNTETKPVSGDGIADKYQVLVEFKSADTEKGTVETKSDAADNTGISQVYTLKGEDDQYLTEGSVTATTAGVETNAKTGYGFTEWKNDDQTVKFENDKHTFDKVQGGKTIAITAQWKLLSFETTVIADGGVNVITTLDDNKITYDWNATETVTITFDLKEGYTLTNVKVDRDDQTLTPDANGVYTVTVDKKSGHEVTITTSNQYTYTVKYYQDSVSDNNHLNDATGTAAYGTSIASLADLTKYQPTPGYGTGVVQVDKNITKVEADNLINVVYSKVQVTYTVVARYLDRSGNKVDDVTLAENQEATYGTAINQLTLPTDYKQARSYDGKKYIYWDGPIGVELNSEKYNGTTLTEDGTTIILYYNIDQLGGTDDNPGDNIPDKDQIVFTYQASANGSFGADNSKNAITKTTEVITKNEEGNATPNAVPTPVAAVNCAFDYWKTGEGEDAQTDYSVTMSGLKENAYTSDTTFTAYFNQDEAGKLKEDGTQTGDGTPDKYQVFVKFVSADNNGTVATAEDAADNTGIYQVYTFKDHATSGSVTPSTAGVKTNASTGYEFSNWTKDDGEDAVTPTDTLKEVSGGTTIVFKAHWQLQSFTTTVIADGGVNVITTLDNNKITYDWNATETVTITFDLKEGYTLTNVKVDRDDQTLTPDANGVYTVTVDKKSGHEVTITTSNQYTYTVKYYQDSVSDNNHLNDATGTAAYGTSIASLADLNKYQPTSGYGSGTVVDADQNKTISVTAANNVISVVYSKVSIKYAVVAHYRNRAGTEVYSEPLTENATSTYGTELSSLTTAYEKSRTYNEKTYLYDNSARSVKVGDTVYTGTTLTENNTVINLYYDIDELGTKEGLKTGDGVADKNQIVFTYEASANGSFGTDDSKNAITKTTEVITKDADGNAKPSAVPTPLANTGYKFNYWQTGNIKDTNEGMKGLKDQSYNTDTTFTANWKLQSFVTTVNGDSGVTVTTTLNGQKQITYDYSTEYETISFTLVDGYTAPSVTVDDDPVTPNWNGTTYSISVIKTEDHTVVINTTAPVSYTVVANYKDRTGNVVGQETLSAKDATAASGTQISTLIKDDYKSDRTYTVDGVFQHYVFDSSATTVKAGEPTYSGTEIPTTLTESGTVIDLYYDVDEWVDPTIETDGGNKTTGDGIADKYQVLVEFKSADTEKGTVATKSGAEDKTGICQVYTLKEDGKYVTEGSVTATTAGVETKAETGYEFKEWKNNGQTVEFTDNQHTFDQVQGGKTITITAQWKLLAFKITITVEGGDVTVKKPVSSEDGVMGASGEPDLEDVKYEEGTELTVDYGGTSNAITFEPKEGYVLKSVIVDDIDVTKDYQDGTYTFDTVTEDHTIAVEYVQVPAAATVTQYTLTYVPNNGGENITESKNAGTTVSLSKTVTREGYTFTGWYADEALTQKVETVTMNKDITVYAGWQASTVPEMLNGDDHFAYIVGYEDGSVQPTGDITRAEVATIFFRLLKEDIRNENLTSENPFEDVPETAWYCKAVSTLTALGIIQGRTDTSFAPNEPITRAELATICARFDTGVTSGDSTFTDTAGHWAEAEIQRAASLGWIEGDGDGKFRPNDSITRAEAITMINRVLCRIPESESDLIEDMNTWPDNANVSAWYYLAIQEATNSHDYEHKGEIHETWTEMQEDPDWEQYEK